MTSLDLTFVGSGNAFSPGGLCCNGFAVNGKYLFETPPTLLVGGNKAGLDFNAIDAVVISHHHGDHFLGLPFLLLQWKYHGRKRPARIIGPRGTRELAELIACRTFPGAFDLPFELEWEVAEPGKLLTVGGLRLEPVAMEHDTRLGDCLGFRGELGGRRFAYTGDTRFCDAVVDLARGAEVLVSECASRDLAIPVHMNLVDDMPRVRAAMDPEAMLILTHLAPGVRPEGLARTVAAEDFATYRL